MDGYDHQGGHKVELALQVRKACALATSAGAALDNFKRGEDFVGKLPPKDGGSGEVLPSEATADALRKVRTLRKQLRSIFVSVEHMATERKRWRDADRRAQEDRERFDRWAK